MAGGLIQDSALEGLLQENFDPKSFASSAIQSQMVGETLAKLTNGIASLDEELYTQVVTNYEDLLSQATGIEALESVLKMMQVRIESLQGAVGRINSKIVDPYQKIVSRTVQLSNLQEACDLLRKVIRMLYLLKRLKSQMQGGNREITKVAQTFSEIDILVSSGDLTGIKVLEEERVWLNRARREVEAQAKLMLLQGLELMNPTPISISLQVFYNLGQLTPTLHSILTGFRTALQHDSQIALDPATLVQGLEGGNGPGRSSLPTLGSSASWKAVLWTRIEKLVNSIQKMHSQVYQLYIVLVKKKDPISHTSFLQNISQDDTRYLLVHFWEAVASDLAVEFSAAAKASTFLRQMFEVDYPKLVRAFSDLISRLEKFGSPDNQHSSTFSRDGEREKEERDKDSLSYESALLDALSPFEKAYISRSQSRLLDSVSQLFGPSSRGLPREDEIMGISKTFNSELSSAGGSAPLANILAKNIDKAIRLFNMKCDELVLSGRDSVQVSSGPNHAQLRNITIVNSLYFFHNILNQHVLNVSSVHNLARDIIARSLAQTHTQMRGVVSPFIKEVQQMLVEMMESMHSEDFSGDVQENAITVGPDPPCSGFMREMQSFTSRIHAQHLSKYQCKEEISTQLEAVTVHILELYVRHVTLLRPLGEGGKMKVATDMAQLEFALTPFHQKLADLGLPYRKLRALRRLLFLSNEQFISDAAAGIGDTMPYSYVLNYLFSRAPRDMKSPHQVQGWSEGDYGAWMDSHTSEKDRLAFIRATVESYMKRNKDITDANHICHVMSKLIQKGIESY